MSGFPAGAVHHRRSCLAWSKLLSLLVAVLADALRSRQRLLLENLLLRQQLQVALRPLGRPRLRARDKLFWLALSTVQGVQRVPRIATL
jgi:hypothetical protein